jgi:hypothetical protein
VDLAVHVQLARGVDQRVVAKRVERLRIAGRGDDARGAEQAARFAVLEHEQVELLAGEIGVGAKRILRQRDACLERAAVVRQRMQHGPRGPGHQRQRVEIGKPAGAYK